MPTRMRAIAVLAALTGALILALPATASAHDELVSSDPTAGATLDKAPEQVVLTFNEAVQSSFTRVVVLDSAQRHFESGSAQVDDTKVTQQVRGLVPGSYTISYRIVSADGHPVSSTVRFTVSGATASSASPAPDVTNSASDTPWWRTRQFVGLMIILVLSLALLVRPAQDLLARRKAKK